MTSVDQPSFAVLKGDQRMQGFEWRCVAILPAADASL